MNTLSDAFFFLKTFFFVSKPVPAESSQSFWNN